MYQKVPYTKVHKLLEIIKAIILLYLFIYVFNAKLENDT